jgi:hypothetical protein
MQDAIGGRRCYAFYKRFYMTSKPFQAAIFFKEDIMQASR